MIIDCIGCLHGSRPKLDGGDLLIVTGDLTAKHTFTEHYDVLHWIDKQDYIKKVLIAGNHDDFLEKNPNFYSKTSINYLLDSGTEFGGLKIWGSPWSASFKAISPKAVAFTKPFGIRAEGDFMDKWEQIPSDTDILVTHTPAFGILDGISIEDGSLYHVGNHSLYGWLEYVHRPFLHVFSHIHEGYGQEEHFPTRNDKMMISVNCSIMNANYKPVNEPIRVIL